MFRSDTIAAIATPPGEGGIAVIRVSGKEARQIAARVFRPKRGGDPTRFPGYSVHYGDFWEAVSGEVADDGLLTVFLAPHSYTGEDTIELACHGGRATTARVLKLIIEAGARLAEPGEFTLRAFLNGKMDLAQAEAVADVIRARTETACRVARRQLEGTLSQTVATLKEDLVGILAAIEVTIDFSDEVGELEHEPIGQRIAAVRARLERLLATAERGRILREGLRVAIIGRPNVGKSSLLNAVLRADRAIVTPIAGTTRDILEEVAQIAGIPVVLIDTAGQRETDDVVERIGVERAQGAVETADVVLFVLEASEGVTEEDRRIADTLEALGRNRLLVALNKSDLVDASETESLLQQAKQSIPARAYLLVSAQTHDGLEQLEHALIEPAQSDSRHCLAERNGFETVVVSSVRHREALEAARNSLREAERTTTLRLPGDFIAIDVRGALDALGLITGETVTEDIIHRIFRDFCVGK
jgi:tRNA modification GTPase